MKKKATKQLHTLTPFATVLQQARTSPVFETAYQEELARLRLAKEIKTLRTKQALTQTQVATLTNMPQSVIARVEGGRVNVSVETLDKIARVLGKEVRLV